MARNRKPRVIGDPPDVHVAKVVHTTFTLTLKGVDVRALLVEAGYDIPKDAIVTVRTRVPGGGDWSNTYLDIDTDAPLEVTWSRSHQEEGDVPLT